MISSEVKRTLVKSPPELWAELSDPAALTRHLGALGEIRITRTEPEKLVEWETEGTSGVVQIKPSGWGTKVTLSATRELEPHEQPEAESSASNQEPTDAEPAGEASEPVPLATGQAEVEIAPEAEVAPEAEASSPTEASPESVAELEQEAGAHATEPRRGFFARLFGRRRPKGDSMLQSPAPEPVAEMTLSQPDPAEPASHMLDGEPQAVPADTAIELLQARFAPAAPEPEPIKEPVDLAAELKAAEEGAAEEVTAVLTAVLDRLGAAHHRPFSRA